MHYEFHQWGNQTCTLKNEYILTIYGVLRGLLRLFVEARMVCTNFFLAEHNAFKNAIHLELPFWALMDNKSNEWAYMQQLLITLLVGVKKRSVISNLICCRPF